MPPLKLFGRKWLVAADDFVFPGLLELVIKIIWIILYGLTTKKYFHKTFECANGGIYVRVYLIGMLVLLTLNIVLLLALINRSGSGGICDVNARRCVSPIITCKLVYDPVGCTKIGKIQEGEDLDTIRSQKVTRQWMKRLKWLCCCVSGKEEKQEALAIVAGLFKDLCINTDLTPTDVIAGLILVWEKQEKEREQKKYHLNYGTGVREMFKEKPSWVSIELGKHYCKLSMAMYSWPMALYVYYCLGVCCLLRHCRCSSCCRSKKGPTVKKDNCCECKVAGFQTLSGVSRKDILYCDFCNKLYHVQFVVIFDRITQCVVVCIRGSMSLPDLFTDLVAVPEPLDIEGLPPGTMAHKGMWRTAVKLKDRLDENQVLEKAFALQPDYNLVITGHSLGAGVGVFLGLLYRPKYPDLKVYGYATPGILTKPGALHCQSFVWTIGLHDDLVLRASIDNVKRLRSEIFKALQQTKSPKFWVLLKGLYYTLWRDPFIEHPHKAREEDQNLLEPNFFAKAEENWQGTDVPMYPVGHILHISRIHMKREKFCRCCIKCCQCGKLCCKHIFICCCRRKKLKHKKFDMCWLPPDHFNEMRLLPRLNLDHVPDTIYQAIDGIIMQQCLEIETESDATQDQTPGNSNNAEGIKNSVQV